MSNQSNSREYSFSMKYMDWNDFFSFQGGFITIIQCMKLCPKRIWWHTSKQTSLKYLLYMPSFMFAIRQMWKTCLRCIDGSLTNSDFEENTPKRTFAKLSWEHKSFITHYTNLSRCHKVIKSYNTRTNWWH